MPCDALSLVFPWFAHVVGAERVTGRVAFNSRAVRGHT